MGKAVCPVMQESVVSSMLIASSLSRFTNKPRLFCVHFPPFLGSPWKRGHSFQTETGPWLLYCPAPISNRKTGRPMKIRDTM